MNEVVHDDCSTVALVIAWSALLEFNHRAAIFNSNRNESKRCGVRSGSGTLMSACRPPGTPALNRPIALDEAREKVRSMGAPGSAS